MLFTGLGFALGVFAFQQFPQLPDAYCLLLLPPLLACWWKFPRLAPLWAVFAGLIWGLGHALVTQPRLLPEAALHDTVLASGVVQGIPHHNQHRTRFFFQVNQLQYGETSVPGRWRFRISWYRKAPEIIAGEKWVLPLRLKTAHGYHNPGGFDYEGWLYARGVRYTGYVKGEGKRVGNSRWSLDRLRQSIAENISRSGISPRSAAIVRALVVGDRSALSSKDKAVFAATGTSHLIAISGLHIGLIATLAYFLVRRGWRLFPRACSRWPATVAAAPAAILAALVYAALAGFSIPTQRALIMLLIVMLGILFRRAVSASHVLGLALLAVVLWDPLSVTSAGFWLSFGAVAVILYLARGEAGRFSWLRLQLGISLALAPLLVWQRLPVSLLSPAVNLLAIPVFALLIVPLSLAAMALQMVWADMAQMLLSVTGWLLDGCLWVLDAASELSPTVFWEAASPPVLVVSGMAALGGAWWAAKAKWRPLWRLSFPAVALLCLVLILRHTPAPPPNRFRFTLLDVGQGLSAVVRTARHVLVFDTGPRFPSGFNTGAAVLIPYLRSQGIHGIDMLVLSHSDIDHVGGSAALFEHLPVGDVLSGEPEGMELAVSGRPCLAGDSWWWDGVKFEIVYPPSDLDAEGNDASCVLKVTAGGQSALITGDIEEQGENWLAEQAPEKLQSEIVVAAHHGSASSSSKRFVRATQAYYVLFAAGKNNRWGFPREVVVDRWQGNGATTLNTADTGAIEFILGDGQELAPLSWAGVSRRYWHK
ncbi:DNA internalization-related competence protein ComEC/Rec2 [Thiolapillus sp.]